MKKKTNVSVFEIIVYSLFGAMALWGIVYLILGFACNYVSYKSPLAFANARLNLGFLNEGAIILAVAVVVLVITLLVTSKKSDREFEKSQRRAARMAQRNNEVVDAEVSE